MRDLEQVLTQINDNWDAQATIASQNIEADGVFFVDPTLGGDYDIQKDILMTILPMNLTT